MQQSLKLWSDVEFQIHGIAESGGKETPIGGRVTCGAQRNSAFFDELMIPRQAGHSGSTVPIPSAWSSTFLGGGRLALRFVSPDPAYNIVDRLIIRHTEFGEMVRWKTSCIVEREEA